ncbi:MAG: winged helix-turn-helix domain-containing protein [Acidilobaceae archaeon]
MKRYVVLILVIAIALASQLALSRDALTVVPLDSCSFEVSRELSERKLVESVIVYPSELETLDLRKARLVVLTAYPPEETNLKAFLKLVEEGRTNVYASSDLLTLQSSRTVSSEDLRAWCELNDEKALLRVAESLKADDFSMTPLLTLGVLAVTLAILKSSTNTLNKVVEKVQETPAVLAALYLKLRKRGKLEESEVFDHPIRASIIEALRESSMSFSQLQQKLNISRAVLEWHLEVLKSYGVVLEERNGRSRVYRLAIRCNQGQEVCEKVSF